MRTVTRLLLAVVAVVAGALSLISLLWWLAHSYNAVTGHGGFEMLKQLNPGLIARADPTNVFFFHARDLFSVLGGLIGWLALFRLMLLANYRLNELPKWVVYGCVVGVAAAIALPGGGIYAYFPIVTAVALLLRCHFAAPNPSLNPDAPTSGAPVS